MVKTGLDILFTRKRLLTGKRLGLVANPTSIDSKFRFIVDLFHQEKEWKLKALFGPEHGMRGEMQDQESCETYRDPVTQLPVYSLYGQHLKPSSEMLEDLDTVVFDMQDIGSRYYTFIYTLAYIMEACKDAKVEVIVLDRPNPIGGVEVEGPILEKGFESFVGLFPIPIRHGMTVGELALCFHKEFGIDCQLEVVEMDGWTRSQFFEDTKLPWVIPSPNMPNVDAAIVYPGQCLLEGTNVSEGRGTTRPFEIFGAPWIDPETFCNRMEQFRLPGVFFRKHYFRPKFNKFQNELCGGAQMHVIDRSAFKPVRTTLCLLHVLLEDYRQRFAWKQPPYEFVTDRLPIDVLFGNPWIREELERGVAPDLIEEKWQAELQSFLPKRERYLLYE